MRNTSHAPLRDFNGRFIRASASPALPVMSVPSKLLLAEEFNSLQESYAELSTLMKNLLARFNSMLAATAPMPAPVVPVQQGNLFVPLIPGAGIHCMSSPAISLSLCTQFPDVNMAAIMAIIMHKFREADLYKLDPTNCNKKMAYIFNGSINLFEISN